MSSFRFRASREPFSERLSRPKKNNGASGFTPRKTKYGSENVPPEDENMIMRGNMNEGGGTSPAKVVSRSRPPKPPLPRTPTPSTKRKLGLESIPEHNTSVAEKPTSDSGVQVVIRIRPMMAEENEVTQVVHMLSPNTVAVVDQQFTFDAVAGMESTQKDVFELVGLPLVENCMAGFNSSIFAYGQTGSGKTYTMWGPTCDSSGDQFPNKDRGLTPRVFEQLFARIQEEESKNIDKQLRYQCRCSFLEIYNEHITDLLVPSQKNLQIREDVKTGVYVDNLTEEYVCSLDDVKRLAVRGLANRRVGATSMNAESSRSHSVFTCVLESRCKSLSDGLSSLRTSRINLVDLAGSERQKSTGAAGDRLKEAGNINRSLSQLGNLIKILAEVSQTGKQRHIPYRDSRLTFLLQESLGGNAKLAMVCAISAAGSCRNETLSTLRFAQRAKAIKNKAVVNEEMENDVNLLRDQIRQLKDELMRMKSKDNNQPASTGGYSTGWNARRSLSLLRRSLAPLTSLPHTDTDSDEEMEIDEDAVEELFLDKSSQSTYDDEASRDSRTSSSNENEEIETTLHGLKRDNLNVSTEDYCNGDRVCPSKMDSVVTCQEIPKGPSAEGQTNLEKNAFQFDNSGMSSSHDVSTEAVFSKSDDSESSKDICGASGLEELSNHLEIDNSIPVDHEVCKDDFEIHTEGQLFSHEADINDAKQKTEYLGVCSNQGIHSSVQMDQELLRDDFEFHQEENPCASKVELEDGTSTIQNLRTSSNDCTMSVGHAPDSENNELTCEKNCVSPTLSIVPCPSTTPLQSPPLSISPRISDSRKSINKSYRKSTLSPPNENGNNKLDSEMTNLSFAQSVRRSGCIQSDISQTSPADRLAASLQRGLEIFDHQQQNSVIRKSSARFSFQPLNMKMPLQLIDKTDKGIQTSPRKESSSATSTILHASGGRLDIVQQTTMGNKEDIHDKSQWQLMPLEEKLSPAGPKHQLTQAVEGVLAGSIRREMALEEVCNKQAAEIEHLNRLVRQYKHERECNSIIQQAREEKIARLEGLMDGAITSEDYLKDELQSLTFEHKLLEDKYQNHPEVTRLQIEEKHLLEELEKYRNFYELGERDALVEEIQNLRTQLQYYLESNTPVSAKSLRMSVMALKRPELRQSAHSLGLCTIPEAQNVDPDSLEKTLSEKKWDEENREWTERESEWIALVDDLRAELDSVNRLAEKTKKELESEQICAAELKEALQMAMEGHARILDQYAELQEKHIGLLAKHRRIREGVADAKRAAVLAGAKGAQLSLIENQAAQIMTLKLEREQERQMMKEEINGLESQLRDTVDAVQAAGELVVRLKDAEEAVSIAQDAASHCEQEAESLRRDIEKLKRKHATESAVMNQRLLESRLQKSSPVCPMCEVAKHVKFEFPDTDDATLEAASVAAHQAQKEWKGQLENIPQEFEEHDEFFQMDKPAWFRDYDECNI